jgi:hypothetical protein
MIPENVAADIKDEMLRQHTVYRDMTHPGYKWMTILIKQCGEFANAIIRRDLGQCRHEVVQIAAVAIQIIKAIDDQRTTE